MSYEVTEDSTVRIYTDMRNLIISKNTFNPQQLAAI